MSMNKILCTLVCFIVLIEAGCRTPPRSATPSMEVKFYMGRLMGDVDLPIAKFCRASERALQDLDVDIKIVEHDGLAGQILACDVDQASIFIDLEALPGNKTHFSIRVGWADKNTTQIIFNKIKTNL